MDIAGRSRRSSSMSVSEPPALLEMTAARSRRRSSTSRSLTVHTMIGTRWQAGVARNREMNSKPSTPGISRSTITSAGGSASAANSASSALALHRAWYPNSRKAASASLSAFGSSSTTRTVRLPAGSPTSGPTSSAGTIVIARGRMAEKVLPSPGVLRTVTRPPSASASRFVSARPRPVPWYFFAVLASSCWNSTKSLPKSSA